MNNRKVRLLALCSVWLWIFTPIAGAADIVSVSVEKQAVVFALDDGTQVSLGALGNDSISVVYNVPGVKSLPSQAISPTIESQTFITKEEPSRYLLSYNDVGVEVTKSPFHLAYAYKNTPVIAEEKGLFVQDTLRGFRFTLADNEKLYGGGERVSGMDRRGQRMPLYNRAHYGYTTESNQMYFGLPAVLSSQHYALIFDNTASGYLDIGASEHNVLQFEAVGGRLAYVVVLGDSIKQVSENLVDVTGRQPLPPRWALGNFASRFGYHTQKETEATVAEYQRQGIPLDGIVLDLYWFGKDVKGHMGNLQWDRDAFPHPEKMISSFASQDIHTIVITEPFILTTSSQFDSAVANHALAKNLAGQPKTFDFFFGNTGLVDVFSEKGQDWFWQYYDTLLKQGVTGWWGDLGEPEVHPSDTLHDWQGTTVTADEIHNAYGHQWAKMLYTGLKKRQPDKRPYLLMRSGFAGSQRYGMIPWTGDVSRSWGGLKPQVELSLQMGMFGLAYTHSDLGGFAGGDVFDPELYIRWLQFGAFQPVFRPHAQEDIAPEPVFHTGDANRITADMIRLRYQLLPYNYSLVYENSLHGLPLMRPMSFNYSEADWFDEKGQYLWGDSFLVAPVTESGVDTWPVKLPQGRWYNFFGDKPYHGGETQTLPVTLDTFPLMVKGGAIVPMVEVAQSTAKADFSKLTVHYWLDDKAGQHAFTYYEDDGANPDAIADNAYLATQFAVMQQADGITLSAQSRGQYREMPSQRSVTWVIHGLSQSPLHVLNNQKTLSHEVTWDESAKLLTVTLPVSANWPRLTVKLR